MKPVTKTLNNMMRKLIPASLMIGAAAALTACGQAPMMPAAAQVPVRAFQAQTHVQAQPQELLVRFSANVGRQELQAFNQKYALQTQSYLPELNAYVMTLTRNVQSEALHSLVAQMSTEPVVAMVEVNQRVSVAPVPYDVVVSPIINQ